MGSRGKQKRGLAMHSALTIEHHQESLRRRAVLCQPASGLVGLRPPPSEDATTEEKTKSLTERPT